MSRVVVVVVVQVVVVVVFVFAVLCSVAARAPCAAATATATATATALLWPRPLRVDAARPGVPVALPAHAADFDVVLDGPAAHSDVLVHAAARTKKILYPPKGSSSVSPTGALLSALHVTVVDVERDLGPAVPEGYTLSVSAGPPPRAALNATTVWGALHGLETFTQAVQRAAGSLVVHGTPLLVVDTPRFSHRGVLVDTARHYLPLDALMHVVDAMAFSKFNVLHWHIVDAESFPAEIPGTQLADGAWAPTARYTIEQLGEVVVFARDRGVRVIVELDTPGHAASWGVGYPDIVAACPSFAHNVNNIPLNPAIEKTFDVLGAAVSGVAGATRDPYFHIGGDEVVYGCWAEDARLAAWMREKGFTSLDQVMAYYEGRLWAAVAAANRSAIAWQEVFNKYNLPHLPDDLVVQVWKDEETLHSVASTKRAALLSYGWYLGHLALDWKAFYTNEPFSGGGWTPAQEKYVLGGEVCAWGETLNVDNLDQRLWPRAAAAAERLWSPREVTNITDAEERLVVHICRLNSRGVRAEPIRPNWCSGG